MKKNNYDQAKRKTWMESVKVVLLSQLLSMQDHQSMKTHILDEGWESNSSSLDMMRVKYVCVI